MFSFLHNPIYYNMREILYIINRKVFHLTHTKPNAVKYNFFLIIRNFIYFVYCCKRGTNYCCWKLIFLNYLLLKKKIQNYKINKWSWVVGNQNVKSVSSLIQNEKSEQKKNYFFLKLIIFFFSHFFRTNETHHSSNIMIINHHHMIIIIIDRVFLLNLYFL